MNLRFPYKSIAFAVFCVVSSANSPVLAQSFEDTAREKLSEFSDVPSPPGEHEFEINADFPRTLGPKPIYPWETIDFSTDPAAYMEAIKGHFLSDQALINADFDVAGSRTWFHAPWLVREPVRGLTSERGSREGELWPGQPGGIENWAVSFYNERGGFTLGEVWRDPANPNASAARFPIGTVGFKLLFTAATPNQVPYLSGSKVWRGYIDQGSQQATDMRLLQLDIAVRDSRADSLTGWVFGTFMYYDPSHSETMFDWGRVIPASLTWGNDPQLLGYDYNQGVRPVESWTNPVIEQLFAEVRSNQNGFETSELGLHGRANGPVDNPQSSCLACHGRALDIGEYRPRGYWNAVLPFAPSQGDSDFTIQWFFRNLKPNEPFLHDRISLDYSLQLLVGIRNFRAWKNSVASLGTALSLSADSDREMLLEEFFSDQSFVREFIPERGGDE